MPGSRTNGASGSPPPERPPAEAPPVLLTVDYAKEAERELRDGVAIRDGRLHIASRGSETFGGFGVGDATFRDVILQARVALTEGGDRDYYGVFVRQASAALYYCFGASPGGRVIVGQVAGGYNPVAEGDLAADQVFARGLDAPNLFQVVACGPCLTFVLNGMVVTGVTVDPRYKEGYLGFYLLQTSAGEHAELAADWLQVRAIFPEAG